jgi:protein arginine N-methyltransferase 1
MSAASTDDSPNKVSANPLPTAEYFAEYGQLYDHVGMLQDEQRMTAYHDAIKLNAERHFKGKVVLDLGAGTGVLSIWAAQAGAKHVYAVEATDVATHAEKMAEAHGFGSVITVLRGRMEELELPCKVDVLLSEWMGYFLLRESMVQSVLLARDRWLAPGGVMYPSSARLLVAALDDPPFVPSRHSEVERHVADWDVLASDMSTRYGLSLQALAPAWRAEQEQYTFRQAWQGLVPESAGIGEPQVLLDVDMGTVQNDELFGWSSTVQISEATPETPVTALVGWFDVRFCAGLPEGAEGCVTLDTSPTAAPTHWAHTTVPLQPPLTTPTVGVPSCNSAIRLAHTGTPRTKFLVPSMGSITHCRPLRRAVPPCSSPKTSSPGRSRASTSRRAVSTASSASVTGVRSGLWSTRRSSAPNLATVMASARAARVRASLRSSATSSAMPVTLQSYHSALG